MKVAQKSLTALCKNQKLKGQRLAHLTQTVLEDSYVNRETKPQISRREGKCPETWGHVTSGTPHTPQEGRRKICAEL